MSKSSFYGVTVGRFYSTDVNPDHFPGNKAISSRFDIPDIDEESLLAALLTFNEKGKFFDEYGYLSNRYGLVVGLRVFFDGDWRTLFPYLRFYKITIDNIVIDLLQRFNRVGEHYKNIMFDRVVFIGHVIHIKSSESFLTEQSLTRKVDKVRTDNPLFPTTMDFFTWGSCSKLPNGSYKISLKSSYVIATVSNTPSISHRYDEYSNSGTKLVSFSDYYISSYTHFTRVIGKASRTYKNNSLVSSSTL